MVADWPTEASAWLYPDPHPTLSQTASEGSLPTSFWWSRMRSLTRSLGADSTGQPAEEAVSNLPIPTATIDWPQIGRIATKHKNQRGPRSKALEYSIMDKFKVAALT